eukprot:TRINITY_DN32601_c0_g1_i2.p1 TRINITY_DN32601_c0_g1~~TRINITY_DN32601_c0_g1_i2.p1  ORF type:complete len:435 (-),score=36.41 TRINITY_DN32601_c0_g1_i2:382-1686(-)
MLATDAPDCAAQQVEVYLTDGKSSATELRQWPGAFCCEALLEVLYDASMGPARLVSISVRQFVLDVKGLGAVLSQREGDRERYFWERWTWNGPLDAEEARGSNGKRTQELHSDSALSEDSTSPDEQWWFAGIDSMSTIGVVGCCSALGNIMANATADTGQHVLTVCSSSVVCGSPADMMRLFREERRPRHHWPVKLLLGAAAAVYVLELCVRLTGMPWNQVLYVCGASAGANLTHGQFYRFLTGMFVQRCFPHLISNGLLLLRVSQMLQSRLSRDGQEHALGPLLFFPGVFGNLVSAVVQPYSACVGLSGATYGALGASFYLLARGQMHSVEGKWFIPAASMVAVSSDFMSATSVDYIGHAAAWMGGYLLMPGFLLDDPFRTSQSLTIVTNRARYPAFLAASTTVALVMLVLEQSHVLSHAVYAAWPEMIDIAD